ncbi:MAG: DnaJ domain-containing protein [Alphaproteobacteria bacterium]|nr:DnaJ domain-containing protein [Alphaproteobacteria bacterium]
MTNVKSNFAKTSSIKKAENIISETRRPDGWVVHETFDTDGRVATQIIETRTREYWLIQYNSSGHITFKEPLNNFKQDNITYNNGRIASIRRRIGQNDIITQYDDKGHIVCDIVLEKGDVVNFNNGYVQSLTRRIGNSLLEIEYGENGQKRSSAQKVRTCQNGKEFWLTTETKQYHTNGKLQSVITYEQRTEHTSGFSITTGGGFSSVFNEVNSGVSYIASIAQYDEEGKVVISAQLKETDEVNFNGDKVACITRRVKKGDSLETMSQTTYYPSGNLCTITTYQDGRVVSSVTYDEQGKPQSSAQQGTENYQDIYQNAQQTRQNTQNIKSCAKIGMTPQQAASILGVSLSATEQEVKVAYRKLCKIWHPDRNQGNEEVAKRKMQQINEAYSVMSRYIRNRGGQSRPEQPQQPRPEHINRMQQAWNKLQQAIRDYDYAVDRLKAATAEKERIRSEYVRTAANDQKKRKLEQQLRKAEIAWSACVNNKIRAQAYKDKCEREYNMLRMQKYTKMYQQKCCEYQRAA